MDNYWKVVAERTDKEDRSYFPIQRSRRRRPEMVWRERRRAWTDVILSFERRIGPTSIRGRRLHIRCRRLQLPSLALMLVPPWSPSRGYSEHRGLIKRFKTEERENAAAPFLFQLEGGVCPRGRPCQQMWRTKTFQEVHLFVFSVKRICIVIVSFIKLELTTLLDREHSPMSI